MTEHDAKTKWCPEVRTIPARRVKDGAIEHDGEVPAFNRYNTDEAGSTTLPGSSMCIASSCMYWRWDRMTAQEQAQYEAVSGQPYARNVTGYCGKAGKP